MGILYNAPNIYQVNDFHLGMDAVSSPTALEPGSMREIINGNLTPNKGIEKRSGIKKFSNVRLGENIPVRDIYEWDLGEVGTAIVAICGTKVYVYYNNQWTEVYSNWPSTGRTQFASFGGFCFLFHKDMNKKLYYNGSSFSIYDIGIQPPATSPSVQIGSLTGLTGKYKYVYTYKRSFKTLISNPSPVSQEITVNNQSVRVSFSWPSDQQVDRIVIYRTFNLTLSETDPQMYFKVAEISNRNQTTYDDNKPDAQLEEAVEFDNTPPPRAKYAVVYHDYMVYANCPNEENGESLIIYSKRGKPEACPSVQYEYFDRDDGEEITGIAPLAEFLIVFKKDKIFIVQGDFERKMSVAPIYGIGNIAPYALLPLQESIVFLSEEGWMSTDGQNLYRLSEKIAQAYITAGYLSPNLKDRFSSCFYPAKNQFYFLCDNNIQTPLVFVGHFLVPLLFIDKGIPEQKSGNIVAWTIHQYDYHRFACLSSYHNEYGVIKPLAGGYDGYIYILDEGNDDDGQPIKYRFVSGWFTLTRQTNIINALRRIRMNYSSGQVDNVFFNIYIDFLPKACEFTFRGSNASFCGSSYTNNEQGQDKDQYYCGLEGGNVDRQVAKGKGIWFKYEIYGENKTPFSLQSVAFDFRSHGIR